MRPVRRTYRHRPMRMVFAALAPPPEEETPKGQSMTNQSHYDIATLILSRPGATEADLLRAIAHAVLAGYRPPLAYDAFNPDTTGDNQ